MLGDLLLPAVSLLMVVRTRTHRNSRSVILGRPVIPWISDPEHSTDCVCAGFARGQWLLSLPNIDVVCDLVLIHLLAIPGLRSGHGCRSPNYTLQLAAVLTNSRTAIVVAQNSPPPFPD